MFGRNRYYFVSIGDAWDTLFRTCAHYTSVDTWILLAMINYLIMYKDLYVFGLQSSTVYVKQYKNKSSYRSLKSNNRNEENEQILRSYT